MKLAKLSLAAVIALGTSAFAIDNVKVDGQAVVYYQTAAADTDTNDLFDQGASKANVGLQLNLGMGLGQGFGFGAQATYLGTAGLENNLVSGTMQGGQVGSEASNGSAIALTKLFVTKQINGYDYMAHLLLLLFY